MPPNPGDYQHDGGPFGINGASGEFIFCECSWCQEARIHAEPAQPKVAWLQGDHEYYPVWSTTLYEQDQIWRTKYKLRTSEQRVERLAQEVALYVLINDIAHDS